MNGNSAVLCVHNGIGFKLPLLGFVLVQTEEAMRCLKDIVRVTHSSINSLQGPHSLVFYSKCQYTLAPAVTLCCFVLLSQLGLSCWSFSGWLHHCICLPAVPRLSPCRNLASFKKTKKKEIRIDLFSQTPVLSQFGYSFFSSLTRSCLLLSSVSCYLPVTFPCKQKDGNIKSENGLPSEPQLLPPFTAVEACGLSYVVMESDGKLRPNSSEVRPCKPGRTLFNEIDASQWRLTIGQHQHW